MLDHISLGTNNYTKALAFFSAVLKPLGYVLNDSFEDGAGFGIPGQLSSFWISPAKAVASPGFHLAFQAPSQQAVREFYDAAITHGATGNGTPGLRSDYSPTYYAAYIITEDGHRLEAVHGR